jgi:hypothetical protein
MGCDNVPFDVRRGPFDVVPEVLAWFGDDPRLVLLMWAHIIGSALLLHRSDWHRI